MNTELDSPLVTWSGRIMLAVGIIGWSQVPLYFMNINLFSSIIKMEGSMGLGAILGAIFGGIGAAFVFRTHTTKKEKQERKKSTCKLFRDTGKHDWNEEFTLAYHQDYKLLVPTICKECGIKVITEYTSNGIVL